MLAPHDLVVGGFQRLGAAMDGRGSGNRRNRTDCSAVDASLEVHTWAIHASGRGLQLGVLLQAPLSIERRKQPQPPSRPLFSYLLQAGMGGEGHGLKHFSGQQDFQNTQCAADKANDVSSDLLHRSRSYCIPKRCTPGGSRHGTKVQF